MNPLLVTPKNIDGYRQNRPSFIARDLEKLYGVPIEATWRVLLARGVVKWLSVRRHLIKLKYLWKDRAKLAQLSIQSSRSLKVWKKVYWYRGYLAGLNDCRRDVKQLCHSPRWQIPDNDFHCTPDDIKEIYLRGILFTPKVPVERKGKGKYDFLFFEHKKPK